MTVCTMEDLAEAVRSGESLSIVGSDSGRQFRCDRPAATTLKVGLSGVVSIDKADQVVTVWAGTPMLELMSALAEVGQCIPLGATPPHGVCGTVGGRIALNLPHSLEADCGNWRDWILGMTVVRADGTIAKAGSKAVKNVAGYDVHRLFVGSRGTLGVIARVHLRTYPVKALPKADFESYGKGWAAAGFIRRTLPTGFEEALKTAGESVLATHRRTSTLYASGPAPLVTDCGWIIGWGMGQGNLAPLVATEKHYLSRAKAIFDPTVKLNPGELGL